MLRLEYAAQQGEKGTPHVRHTRLVHQHWRKAMLPLHQCVHAQILSDSSVSNYICRHVYHWSMLISWSGAYLCAVCSCRIQVQFVAAAGVATLLWGVHLHAGLVSHLRCHKSCSLHQLSHKFSSEMQQVTQLALAVTQACESDVCNGTQAVGFRQYRKITVCIKLNFMLLPQENLQDETPSIRLW